MSYRFPTLSAGFFGLTGVVLGALGAHGPLRDFLDRAGTHANWETAVHYQLIHALALFACGAWLHAPGAGPRALLTWAARAWSLGLLFFSGSIYALALGGPKAIGPVTPLGGLALMAGWGCVIAAGLRAQATPPAR